MTGVLNNRVGEFATVELAVTQAIDVRRLPLIPLEEPGDSRPKEIPVIPGSSQEGAPRSLEEPGDSRPKEIPVASGAPQEGEAEESQKTDPGQPASDSARQ